MADEFDPWAQDTGFKDDYDGEVIEAWFGHTERAPDLFLFLKVKARDGEEVENRYGCGSDWATFDGGKTAEHPSKKIFNARCKYSDLVRRAFQCGGEELLRDRAKGNELGPRDAGLWVGSKWHWNVFSEDLEITDRQTQEKTKVTSTIIAPTKFLGIGDTVTKTETAPTSNGLSGDLLTKATVLAKANDYPAWVDKMMELSTEPEVISVLSDENYYQTLRG